MRAVSPEAVLKAIDFMKTLHEDAEWREEGDGYPLDPEGLYQHVRALLAGEDPPELVPAKIVAAHIEGFLDMRMGVGRDQEEAEAMSGPVASPETWEAAAKWGAAFHRAYFKEDPVNPHAIGWDDLTISAENLLRTRANIIAMCSAPLS